VLNGTQVYLIEMYRTFIKLNVALFDVDEDNH